MRRPVALLLCALLGLPGCASIRTTDTRFAAARQKGARADPALMAEYIRQLKIGSQVRISHADGSVIHAILMKHDSDPIVVQRRTRIPEAPIEIPIRNILAMELEASNGGVGRTVAIGAAAAVSATLGVLMLLAAIFSD